MYLEQLKTSLRATAVLTVLTGVGYPLVMTGISQALFPSKANGSLIMRAGRPVGSALIGQPFDDPRYFWGRPSATGPFPYNAAASSGSNLGPLNPALLTSVQDRAAALRRADPGNSAEIPVDLVTSSASGLDPHISPAAARFQLKRVARVRGIPDDAVDRMISDCTRGRWLGVLGEPTVNVLQLNLMLDGRTE